MFWTCDENSVDNAGIFLLLLSNTHTASRSSLFLTLPSQWIRLGFHKKLGGDTAGTADSNWPKGYSIPHDITLNSKSWGKEECHFLGIAEHLPAHEM